MVPWAGRNLKIIGFHGSIVRLVFFFLFFATFTGLFPTGVKTFSALNVCSLTTSAV